MGERGSDTQRRILSAALEVFGAVGFNDARVELITRRAGCSRPAFYQYFSSKDDAFWALAGQLGKEMVELGDRLGRVAPDATGVDQLSRWIDEFITLYSAHAPVFSAFQAASRHHRPMTRGSSRISDRLAAALLHSVGKDGRRRNDVTLAAIVVAVLIRCSFYWESMAGTVERQRLIHGLARLVHRLLIGPIDGVNVDRAPASNGGRRSTPALPTSNGRGHRDLRPRGLRTRRQLLEAGATVLPTRGYHDARVDDIVEAAGVSHGSFYRYFDNKDDLFRVLAEEASTQMIELLDGFPTAAESPALRQWLEDWFTAYGSNGGVISTWQEIQGADPELQRFSQQVAASVLTRLVVMLGRRGFGDPLVEALALLALIERVPYSVLTLQFTERADAIDAMVTIVRRGFMGLPDDGVI